MRHGFAVPPRCDRNILQVRILAGKASSSSGELGKVAMNALCFGINLRRKGPYVGTAKLF